MATGTIKKDLAAQHKSFSISIWDANYFQNGNMVAKKVDKGIEVFGIVITKQELLANSAYNFLLFNDINPSTNIIPTSNRLLAIGTTGTSMVGGCMIPLASNTSAIQLQTFGTIPANSTLYFQGKIYTADW